MALEKTLAERAMSLSEDDRAELARQLLESLGYLECADDEADGDPSEAAEVEHRSGQIERGEVELLDAKEVLNRIRERLKAGRVA